MGAARENTLPDACERPGTASRVKDFYRFSGRAVGGSAVRARAHLRALVALGRS